MDVTELVCYPRNTATQRYLLAQVRRLKYDDALVAVRLGWRLEYRQPLEGEDHYLLVQAGEPVALQYVKSRYWLNEVQIKLAVYLALLGFKADNTDFRPGEAEPRLSYVHNRLPAIFGFDYWYKQREDEDDSKMLVNALESIRAITQQTLPAVLTPKPGDKALYDELQQIDRRVSTLLVEKHNARNDDENEDVMTNGS